MSATDPACLAARIRAQIERAEGLEIRVIPGAAREELIDEGAERALKVKVRAAAQDGKANRAVLKLLAKQVGLRERQLQLLSGAKSREKRVGLVL